MPEAHAATGDSQNQSRDRSPTDANAEHETEWSRGESNRASIDGNAHNHCGKQDVRTASDANSDADSEHGTDSQTIASDLATLQSLWPRLTLAMRRALLQMAAASQR